MAKLSQYVPATMTAGSSWDIYAKKLLSYWKIGNGTVTSEDDFTLVYSGSINVLWFSGSVQIELGLIDRDLTAVSGPAKVVLNGGPAKSATYAATPSVITITATLMDDSQQVIQVCRGNGEREAFIALSGHQDADLHLAPA
ncbi:hypothetical protein [Alsobacter sp. R-9]